MDPALVVRAMLGAMNWTVTWFRPEGPDTAADVAAGVAALPRARHREPESGSHTHVVGRPLEKGPP